MYGDSKIILILKNGLNYFCGTLEWAPHSHLCTINTLCVGNEILNTVPEIASIVLVIGTVTINIGILSGTISNLIIVRIFHTKNIAVYVHT